MADATVSVTCCVAGGGPAGMMLGLLLARAGVRVMVLEKHADFLRDFRGDTIHPSTLEVVHELGLLDGLLRLPHQPAATLGAVIGGRAVRVADFSRLPTHCRYIAFMPQWHFLDFLAGEAKRHSGFDLRMEAEVVELTRDGGKVTGLRAKTPDGMLEVSADLVVGADGRHSTVRQQAGLTVDDLGAPIDVLWFRLSRQANEGGDSLGRIEAGRILVMIDRGDYWQCAFVIPKSGFDALRARGLPAFRDTLAGIDPALRDRLDEIGSWDDVKLLTVTVDRLRCWHMPGLLCIGDAAHAMSPIGGVGINLAVQDAVATANLLTAPLLAGSVAEADLERVQRRRMPPTRLTQGLQVFMQNRVISRVLASTRTPTPPWQLRLLNHLPSLRRLLGRLVGMGFRPEHVRPDR